MGTRGFGTGLNETLRYAQRGGELSFTTVCFLSKREKSPKCTDEAASKYICVFVWYATFSQADGYMDPP